jgi:hypothetical protein
MGCTPTFGLTAVQSAAACMEVVPKSSPVMHATRASEVLSSAGLEISNTVLGGSQRPCMCRVTDAVCQCRARVVESRDVTKSQAWAYILDMPAGPLHPCKNGGLSISECRMGVQPSSSASQSMCSRIHSLNQSLYLGSNRELHTQMYQALPVTRVSTLQCIAPMQAPRPRFPQLGETPNNTLFACTKLPSLLRRRGLWPHWP